MSPVLTGDGERCSRLFGEVGHYALDLRGVSNAIWKELAERGLGEHDP
jgi:hypothetical protein